MSQTETVPQEYKDGWVQHLKFLTLNEQFGADCAGYWLHDVPVDDEKLWQLRLDMAKFVYDEARHARLLRRVMHYFGDSEAVDGIYDEWGAQGDRNWLKRMNRIGMEGFDDYIDFLAVIPITGDATGLEFFADIAEHSPDPFWADVAESIHEDEFMHVNLGAEYIPYIVERHGEELKSRLERTLQDWLPFMHALNGHPDSDLSRKNIDRGMYSLHASDLHEIQRESLHEVYDPLGIEVPELDDDDYLKTGEMLEYGERVLVGE